MTGHGEGPGPSAHIVSPGKLVVRGPGMAERLAVPAALFGCAAAGSFWTLGLASYAAPAIQPWAERTIGAYGWLVLAANPGLAYTWLVAAWIALDEGLPKDRRRAWIGALIWLNLSAGAALVLGRALSRLRAGGSTPPAARKRR